MRRAFSAWSFIGLAIGVVLGSVALALPSQAANVPIAGGACGSVAPPTVSQTVQLDDTLTFTVGTGCTDIIFGASPAMGAALSAKNTTTNTSVDTTGSNRAVSQGDVIEVYIPAQSTSPNFFEVSFYDRNVAGPVVTKYSITIAVPVVPTRIAVTPMSTSIAVGATVTIAASLQDGSGNTDTTDNSTVITATSQPINQPFTPGSVTGSLTATAVNGVATFTFTGASEGLVTFQFSDGTLSGLASIVVTGGGGAAPTPAPVFPPSAPGAASAQAGNGEVTVSWTAPASQGSFPVSNYQVQASPGGKGCLAPATATTCRIAGLRNGTTYTFSVRALNGGGWGAWADAGTVTPTPSPEPAASIVITGSRSGNERFARVVGQTTGLDRAVLQSMVRLSPQTEFAAGSAVQVDSTGEFAWKRRTAASRVVDVYFTAGEITSNTVTIDAAA